MKKNPSHRVLFSSLRLSWDFFACISRDSPWPTLLDSYGSRLCWTHPAQPVDNPTISSAPSRDPLTSFLLSPHSLPFCSYLCLLLLPSTVREPPSASPNPLPPPFKSSSLLPPPCLLLSGRKQHLPLYLTSCCQNCFFPFLLVLAALPVFMYLGITCWKAAWRRSSSHRWGCIFSDRLNLDT